MQQGTVDLKVDEKESVSEWKVVSRSRSASLGDTHLTLLQVLAPLFSFLLFFLSGAECSRGRGLRPWATLTSLTSLTSLNSLTSLTSLSSKFMFPLAFFQTPRSLCSMFFPLLNFSAHLSLSRARERVLSLARALSPPPLSISQSLSLSSLPRTLHTHTYTRCIPNTGASIRQKCVLNRMCSL